MYTSSLMSTQASVSVAWPAASSGAAATGGATGQTAAQGGAASSAFASELSITQQSSTVSMAFDTAGSLLSGSGLSDSLQANETLKMIVAMLVLTYLLGNEDQQSGAMDTLSQLLGQESEQLSLSISSTSMSTSMQIGGGGESAGTYDATGSTGGGSGSTGGSVDVMA